MMISRVRTRDWDALLAHHGLGARIADVRVPMEPSRIGIQSTVYLDATALREFA